MCLDAWNSPLGRMSSGVTFSEDSSNANIKIVGYLLSENFSVRYIPLALISVLAEITFSSRVTTSVSWSSAGLSHVCSSQPQAALLDLGPPHWVD